MLKMKTTNLQEIQVQFHIEYHYIQQVIDYI